MCHEARVPVSFSSMFLGFLSRWCCGSVASFDREWPSLGEVTGSTHLLPSQLYNTTTILLLRAILACLFVAFLTTSTKVAQAQAPKPPPNQRTQTPSGKKNRSMLSPDRLEWGAIGGPSFDIDTGLQIAGFVHIAQFRKGVFPYLWRLRFTFKFSIRSLPDGFEFPVHDYVLRMDMPGLVNNRLRAQLRAGFSTVIAQYYGLGNAAGGERTWKQYDRDTQKDLYIGALRNYQYRRTSPYASGILRWKLAKSWSLFGSLLYDYNIIELYKKSVLQRDTDLSRASDQPNTAQRKLLYGTSDHSLLRFNLGLLWDTRVDEFAPSRGWFHELSIRWSPGAVLGQRYSFFGLNGTFRFYASLWKEHLVVAFRGVADMLWGQVPFYLLADVGGLNRGGFSGNRGVRGVRLQRYHGKAKVFGNLELRAKVIRFPIGKSSLSIGLTAFFDAGRTWLDYGHFSALDGEGLGIHLGTGGGLRVQWGKSLIIRFDIAWSPDADPIGFYFDLGHVF